VTPIKARQKADAKMTLRGKSTRLISDMIGNVADLVVWGCKAYIIFSSISRFGGALSGAWIWDDVTDE
jgi:hypothetical protein